MFLFNSFFLISHQNIISSGQMIMAGLFIILPQNLIHILEHSWCSTNIVLQKWMSGRIQGKDCKFPLSLSLTHITPESKESHEGWHCWVFLTIPTTCLASGITWTQPRTCWGLFWHLLWRRNCYIPSLSAILLEQ